jgi:hypothetical protein
VLCNRQVVQLDLDFSASLYSDSVRSDCHILVDCPFPNKVEIEFTAIGQLNNFSLLLIDEEITKL